MLFVSASFREPELPALVRRAQDGDPNALSELLETFRDSFFRLAYHVTGHMEDAEDLAQDAILRIVDRLPSYRGDSAFKTWAYRVALNVCLSSSRSRKPHRSADLYYDLLPDPDFGPERKAIQEELSQRIHREIGLLPPRYREAVLLRLTQDLTYLEVAEVLGISFSAAKTRIFRGLERLRERIGPWLKEDE
jgi:RNA polymerase sigma-70 factor (ECF subfamily)